MDLKDFVADVISQIQDGVTEAINRHDRRGTVGRINPKFPEDKWKDLVQKIEFDIAVTESSKKSGEGGGGVQVHFFNASGKGSISKENSMTNRVKFTIPVALPSHEVSPERSLPATPP
jgi:hypothetical protein